MGNKRKDNKHVKKKQPKKHGLTGRPSNARKATTRSRKITIRLTVAEHEVIKMVAARDKKTVAGFCRWKILL